MDQNQKSTTVPGESIAMAQVVGKTAPVGSELAGVVSSETTELGSLVSTGSSTTSSTSSQSEIIQPKELPQSPVYQSKALQQQIHNQLTSGIFRAIRTGEQQLVIRLHPAELGEVKIDVSMSGDKLSVNFNMENAKVKETLESSMGDFKENMEEKGFTMGDLNVSVGDDDNREQWQMAQMILNGEQLAGDNIDDIDLASFYQHGEQKQYASQDEGVNLFV